MGPWLSGESVFGLFQASPGKANRAHPMGRQQYSHLHLIPILKAE